MSAEDHIRRSNESLAAVKRMEDGLAAGELDMAKYFHEDFVWRGNAGCGTKLGLEAFRNHWQKPIRSIFTDRKYHTEHFMADGDWAACFGYIDALHSGEFMGIPATGKRVTVRYMDFWKVEDGRIRDNWVMVDVVDVMRQLGVDPLDGKGWDARGEGWEPPGAEDG